MQLVRKKKMVGATFNKTNQIKYQKEVIFCARTTNSLQLLDKGCECKIFSWTQRKTG